MLSTIAAENLAKDGRVQGEKWFETYNGWFADPENMRIFTSSVMRSGLLPQRPLEILYIGSASGVLGEELVRALGSGHLTLVDISQKHLELNTNPETTKLLLDVVNMDLRMKFDVIMMRSFLDYFPSRKKQIAVLGTVKKHLASGGVFINQPAYISDHEARNLISQAYCSVPSVGQRLFQSGDLSRLYSRAGLGLPIRYGEGKLMRITEKDHISRYGITPSDVATIQSIVAGTEHFANVTEDGYILTFEFPIFMTPYWS